MKPAMSDHPAVQFGVWMREKRRASGVVARVFAGRIGLSPAEYAELESGVISWLGEKQENLIPMMLRFREDEVAEFNRQLYLAREAGSLTFGEIFSREQLAPTRCCTVGGAQIDATKREAILNAVFTPLNPEA
jgi:hypothetical protein